MKTITKLALLAGLLFAPVQAVKAQADFQFIGTTWAVYSWLHQVIIGQAVVTPSFDLYTWDSTDSAWRFYTKSHRHQKYKFDYIARARFYTETITYENPDTGGSTNNTPFPITGVGFLSYYCNLPLFDAGGNPVGSIGQSKAQSYTFIMTCSVVSTGMAPPTGPFDVSFKTSGTRVPKDCNSTVSGRGYWDSREFRKSYSLMPYGVQTGRMGWVNYSLAWPFQCWAGSVYLY